jgi:Uma2 family endonuclease
MNFPPLEIPATPPCSIELHPPLSDEEFEKLCARSEVVQLERTKEGTIRVNAPTGGMTSDGNSEINRQLRNWWTKHRRGRIFDSNVGFFLRDGSMLSPDAAYVTLDQIEGLTREKMARFLRLAPAFIVELRSDSDRLPAMQRKMEDWMANGVQVGWLIDPYARQVHLYQAGEAPRIESGDAVSGTGPVAGFVLDLTEVWRCYDVD